jgi:hypothetical protein
MADNEFIVTVKANTKPAEKEVETFGDKFVGVGKAAATAFAGVFAASKLIGFFQDSVKEALEAEKAVKQFNFALKAAGVFSEEVSKNFQDYASSLQKVTGVQDEVILKGAQTLIQIGELSGKMLNRTMMASLDFAADRGIDASEAFEMLARAAQGNVTAFSKLGVEFQKNATDAQKFEQVLGFIESKMNGAAKESAKGFQGALNNLSNTWSDMLESFGTGVTQSSFAVQAINALSDSLKWVQVFASAAWAQIKNMGAALEYLGAIGVSTMNAITMMDMSRLTNGVSQATEAYKAHIMENNNAIISYDSLNTKMTEAVIPAFEKQKQATDAATISIQELRSAQEEYENVIQSQQSSVANMADGFVIGMATMSQSARSLGATLSSTMKVGFGNAFAAMGSALVKGEDAFGAFGKSILSMLGNIAIQMGQFYIAAGIAALWLNPAQGAGMIAGGAALSVLGGVLQALGGGGAAAAASAGGASAGAANAAVASGEDTIYNPTNEQEREKPQTGVVINVQGNILDRRETGLELAKVLSESFDTNGTIVRGFA